MPFKALSRLGGARVEKGQRIEVFNDVAERLLALTHESFEESRQGVYVPSFTLQGKVEDTV